MKAIRTQTTCFHCGDLCDTETVEFQEKTFCCHGCKSVYELLQSCDLGDYYQYAETPGIKKLKAPRNESFAYLDNESIAEKLVSFSSPTLVKVKFSNQKEKKIRIDLSGNLPGIYFVRFNNGKKFVSKKISYFPW